MRRLATLAATLFASVAVAAVVLNGISPAAPPSPPICAQDPHGLLPELTGRARVIGPDVPLVARDASATVVAVCVEEGLAAHPPSIRDGDRLLEAAGGFAESYDGAPGVLQYLVYPPTAAPTVELLLHDRAPAPVTFTTAAEASCPAITHPDIEVLSCGWLVRGVWRTDVQAEPADLVDLLASVDGEAVAAYVFGFRQHAGGIDVEFAVPAWGAGSAVTLQLDTVQREFQVLGWTGHGVARLSQ